MVFRLFVPLRAGAPLRERLFVQRRVALVSRSRNTGSLLSLSCDAHRESADVKSIALAKLGDSDRNIEELPGMRKILWRYSTASPGLATAPR